MKNKNLLILGQSPQLLLKAAEMLKSLFDSIQTSDDLKEALLTLKKSPPDFILIGGAVDQKARQKLRDEASLVSGKTITFIEPRGPDEILKMAKEALESQ